VTTTVATRAACFTAIILVLLTLAAPVVVAQGELTQPQEDAPLAAINPSGGLHEATLRLPLAAALGAVLALRPRRRGTPKRTATVIQTQIILAVVGAVIMLVVGSSLARAFGIVGAANLIRYRVKIEDPKDAGVMLCTLALGLASGVGLFYLALFSTVFILVVLAVIESFEPEAKKKFELTVGIDTENGTKNASDLRDRLEKVLERFHLDYELRTTAPEALVYAVKVPYGVETENITNAVLALDRQTPPAVKWDDKAKAK
jgi:uncharacterized membrane protein YhiD involved in acid resistance